ncbi:MAG: hypothetical protein FJX61_00965 [Alphaproteobacteria bacterium]|nr:hypothetical protein [Alphaproteobacteria bacterium]
MRRAADPPGWLPYRVVVKPERATLLPTFKPKAETRHGLLHLQITWLATRDGTDARRDRKGYVGSASGADNLLGRWRDYVTGGHGGNKLLRRRNSTTFKFTILQRVSPDMEAGELTRLENSWKERPHTRAPHGLNHN